MNSRLKSGLRLIGAAIALWGIAEACFVLGANRSTASMMLLLAVLGLATLGDWFIALAASVVGSLSFSFYYVEAAGSFRITTAQGAITFGAMFLTAMIGSQLSLRAQRRALEAVTRRNEMERLHQLGTILLSTHTLSEAAERAVDQIIELFGVQGAVLRIEGQPRVFSAGVTSSEAFSVLSLNSGVRRDVLELYGTQPTQEVGHALTSLLSLVFERARSSEERAKIHSAQRGDEMRTTVLNALAHSFRTPLTSIKAAASALRASAMILTADGQELIAVIDEEADRLDQLIGESLDLARIESHRDNPRQEECRLSVIVERVRKRVARYLGRREFVIDVPEDLPPMLADQFLLEQMLVQVVDNAWKYSRPGSRIRISAETSGKNLLLTIRNEGSEIPESERALIFDKFYRGSGDQYRVEGTGLGLSIARNIAEACHGQVWLEIEPAGPAFRFSLPVGAPGKKSDYKTHYSVN